MTTQSILEALIQIRFHVSEQETRERTFTAILQSASTTTRSQRRAES